MVFIEERVEKLKMVYDVVDLPEVSPEFHRECEVEFAGGIEVGDVVEDIGGSDGGVGCESVANAQHGICCSVIREYAVAPNRHVRLLVSSYRVGLIVLSYCLFCTCLSSVSTHIMP